MLRLEIKTVLPLSLFSLLHNVKRRIGGGVFRCILFTGLLLLCLTNLSLSQITEPLNLTANISAYLVGNETAGPYQLGDGYILQGTEQVERNGLLLHRDVDYFLDYNLGLITFSTPLSLQDTLQVNYTKPDLNLRRKYFHRELVYGEGNQKPGELGLTVKGSSSELSPAFTGKEKKWNLLPQKGAADLNISGSKTFSLELGSAQDVSLKQGLWLQAKGKASPNTEISLQVSDQNLPATQEGTTKRLEELDKVQVNVTSPHFTGTLGDYYLKPSSSELFFYEKKLKGIMAEAKDGINSISLALASSKGEYFTNRFLGEENKQGPYYVRGKDGESGLMILSGTERVWVDGEEMQRGSDNDYTIDYGRGSIQFTPRRLISSDSRITVDFEYSAGNYQRDWYGGNLSAGLFKGKMELKAGGILEKDNHSHPTSFSMSAEDQSILSQAGNDRFSASKDGARFVGEGEGSYNLTYDSIGNAYYKYTGDDSGSFNVSFSWAGEKKGSYRYQGGGVYQYVYPGNGDFLPEVFLPLPESHSLFDLNLSVAPTKAWNAQIEWAKSERDQNTFSSKEDEHNWGDAVSFKSSYKKGDFSFLKSNFYRLELTGEYSNRQKDFAPFGRGDMVEKERRWNLPSNSVSANEETYQFNGLFAPYKSILLNFDYGELNLKGNFTSQRRSLGAELSPASWITVKGKNEKIKSRERTTENLTGDGEWTRNMVILNNRIRKLSTAFSWEQEMKSSLSSDTVDQGDRFDQLSGRAGLELSRVIKTNTELTYRDEDEFKDRWMDKSFSYTWFNQFSLQNYRGMLSSDLEFVRRTKKYKNLLGRDSKENLLVTKMDFYPPSQLLNVKLYHSQNQVYSALRMETYVEVEEGKGDYRYEDGEYYPEADGNFIRQSEWLGDAQSSLDLSKSIRVIFSPHKVSSLKDKKSFWASAGKIFSTDSFINLRGRFREGKGMGFYLLYPLIPLPDKNILSQNIGWRQDLYLLPNSRSINFQLRWEESENIDKLLSGGDKKDREIKQELYLRSNLFSKYFFESRIGREEIKNDLGGKPKYSIAGQSIRVGLTRRDSPSLEFKIASEYKNKSEKFQRIKAGFISLAPEFLWSFLSFGRLKTELQWSHISSIPSERSLPYILAEGKEKGENYDWRLSFDYKLNQYLTSTVVYSGKSVPGEKIKHDGRMELKAYF